MKILRPFQCSRRKSDTISRYRATKQGQDTYICSCRTVNFGNLKEQPSKEFLALIKSSDEELSNYLKDSLYKRFYDRKLGYRHFSCDEGGRITQEQFSRNSKFDVHIVSFSEMEKSISEKIGESLSRLKKNATRTDHVFSIVKDNDGQKYIVDLTIGQFAIYYPQETKNWTLLGKKTRPLSSYPLFSECVEKGYFKLTPENLATYVAMLSRNDDPLYPENLLKHFQEEEGMPEYVSKFNTIQDMAFYNIRKGLA